jgi:hypothetical protein
MTWYGSDEDPFSHIGYARVIVIRHNPSYNYRGQLDNCTIIAHVEAFALGFACPEIKKSRYGHGPSIGYIKDEVREGCEHKINHLFKNKPNGVYELIGEVWAWSSQSYEGEWDGDSELRKSSIREISFDHAMYFECEPIEDELVQLKVDSNRKTYNSDMDISPYMTKQQILCNQANALSSLIEGSYRSPTNWKDSTVQELETVMFTLMLEIDSKNREELTKLSQDIEDKVKYCLDQHEKLMISDS